MPAVFIAQATLQQWADAGKVRLDDTTLFLLKEQRSVVLKPAVRFTKMTVGDTDPHGLLGKVKTTDQLKAMDAEHYMDSVIRGDVAYEVVEGFLGDLQAAKPIAQPVAPVVTSEIPLPGQPVPAADSGPTARSVPAPVLEATAPTTSAEGEPEELSEAEMLSKLFLDTVR